jgi:hypothetical protein
MEEREDVIEELQRAAQRRRPQSAVHAFCRAFVRRIQAGEHAQ